jgi:hypothetical protein
MLSQSQLGFFARNGFLHVPRWTDPDTCRQLVDHTWTRLPPEWRREDPLTWSGSAGDSCHVANIEVAKRDDSRKSLNCVKLFPRGSDLTSEGVRVRMNGHPLPSIVSTTLLPGSTRRPASS